MKRVLELKPLISVSFPHPLTWQVLSCTVSRQLLCDFVPLLGTSDNSFSNKADDKLLQRKHYCFGRAAQSGSRWCLNMPGFAPVVVLPELRVCVCVWMLAHVNKTVSSYLLVSHLSLLRCYRQTAFDFVSQQMQTSTPGSVLSCVPSIAAFTWVKKGVF